jgi:hypothetical protein
LFYPLVAWLSFFTIRLPQSTVGDPITTHVRRMI